MNVKSSLSVLCRHYYPQKFLIAKCSTNNTKDTQNGVNIDVDEELLKNVQDLKRKTEAKRPQCVLCKYDIVPDYKNFRLLSQFISPYSGLMYPMHITGLCLAKHRAVHKEIERARRFGFINRHAKHPEYYNDFPLFKKL